MTGEIEFQLPDLLADVGLGVFAEFSHCGTYNGMTVSPWERK